MRTTDEHSGKYAWRGTLYSMPGKLIPWWQLPLDEAVGYIYEPIRSNTALAHLTICTASSQYTSLVTRERAQELVKTIPPINMAEQDTDHPAN